ncbi:hypothetical protein Tco_0074522 [Tanacetum coccineum]
MGEDEAVYKEREDRLVRAATTTSSLEAAQDSDGGPMCQETMGDTIAQTWFENVSKTSNDSLLEGKTKTSQAQEITSLKRRVKRLEKKEGSRTHKLKRLYKIGSKARAASSSEESLENQGRFNDEEMFDAGVLDGKEVFANVEQEVAAVKEVPVEEVEKVFSTAEVTTAGIEVTTVSATTTTANDLNLA